MSINEATPADWDAIKPTPSPQLKEPECALMVDRYAPSPDAVVYDNVERPKHYNVGEVQAIDYIAQQLGSGVKDYLLGNVHKYLHRHRFKGQAMDDLRKARWYLDKLIVEEING